MTPTLFHEAMMTLSTKYDFRVTSYFRSPKSNAAVGGVSRSWHQLWMACDVVLEEATQAADFVHDAQLLGLKVLNEGDHLHVQPDKG